ncbi:MAG: hypothetical protein VKJ06_03875 [Vampirovibrionales bacterium]|nr:hypothetical protein [Vampirovibrionales bacterium]
MNHVCFNTACPPKPQHHAYRPNRFDAGNLKNRNLSDNDGQVGISKQDIQQQLNNPLKNNPNFNGRTQFLAQHFEKYDTNGDGVLKQQERINATNAWRKTKGLPPLPDYNTKQQVACHKPAVPAAWRPNAASNPPAPTKAAPVAPRPNFDTTANTGTQIYIFA